MGYTRSTHTIRFGGPKGTSVDIEILDTVALILPNNMEICYRIVAVNPLIIDFTGDGNQTAGGSNSSRSSHMTRYTGKDDPSQCFDAECCDAFTMIGPNNTQHLISCPLADAIPHIVDLTGGNGPGGSDGGPNATRAQHVVELDAQIPIQGVLVQDSSLFLCATITDALAFPNGPPFGVPFVVQTGQNTAGATLADLPQSDIWSAPIWHEQYALEFTSPDDVLQGAMSPSAQCNDTTVYVADPETGLMVPPGPLPTDLNVFIFFPDGSGSDNVTSAGPFLGAGQSVDMGPIWWIRDVWGPSITATVTFTSSWTDNNGVDSGDEMTATLSGAATILDSNFTSTSTSSSSPAVLVGYNVFAFNPLGSADGSGLYGPEWFPIQIQRNINYAGDGGYTSAGEALAASNADLARLKSLTIPPGVIYSYLETGAGLVPGQYNWLLRWSAGLGGPPNSGGVLITGSESEYDLLNTISTEMNQAGPYWGTPAGNMGSLLVEVRPVYTNAHTAVTTSVVYTWLVQTFGPETDFSVAVTGNGTGTLTFSLDSGFGVRRRYRPVPSPPITILLRFTTFI